VTIEPSIPKTAKVSEAGLTGFSSALTGSPMTPACDRPALTLCGAGRSHVNAQLKSDAGPAPAANNRGMRVVRHPSVAAFADQVLPWLLRDPVRNNIAASLILSRAEGRHPVEDGALWLGVYDGDDVVSVALRTPPHDLVLTSADSRAVAALVEWCAERLPRLSGTNGPVDVTDGFARRWSELTGATATVEVGHRLFRLDRVTAPDGVPGRLRPAAPDDRELLYQWVAGFYREAVPHENAAGLTDAVDRRLSAGEISIWQDAEPVSMLWTNAPVAGVVRVSGVYTPPAARGHGYASALVAQVSQRTLDAGSIACCLYTDLANPTSNKIYQAIGYEPVQDARLWRYTYQGDGS
jgi:uncharacterized protein